MKPTVGRIVHYYYSDRVATKRPMPAVIHDIHDDGTVEICWWGAGSIPFVCAFSEAPSANCWTWPPRV